MDAEETPVGDRPCIRNGEPSRAFASAHHAPDAIPGDARAELGELFRRVATGQHVEDVLELLPGEIAERIGALHELVELVDGDLLLRADGDDLLRQDVERVPWNLSLLDQAPAHPLDDDRRFEQVGPELREDAALRGLVEAMAGTADALEPTGDGLGRLHLDH
jgi:hypothetical protein